MKSEVSPAMASDFSIVTDGPLHSIYRRATMIDPVFGFAHRRILAAVLIAWAPLLLLTVIEGQAIGGVKLPFLFDVAVQLRLLISLPLLIVAEVLAQRRLGRLLYQFCARSIIAPEDMPRYHEIIASAIRLRASVLAETLILILAFIPVLWFWDLRGVLSVTSWYGSVSNDQHHLMPAGFWYACVSLPQFRFLLFRWYFRLFVWYRVLWQIAHLPLRLNALHPDQAAGLGFLSQTVVAFIPLLTAHTVLVTGLVADRIAHNGATLVDFKMEILGVIVFLLGLVFTPLLFFVVHLARARREALREYGRVGCVYVNEFWRKWIAGEAPQEELIGNSDFQSLADLGNSFNTAKQTRVVPFAKETVIKMGLVIALPLLPLLFTMFSLEKLIEYAAKIIS